MYNSDPIQRLYEHALVGTLLERLQPILLGDAVARVLANPDAAGRTRAANRRRQTKPQRYDHLVFYRVSALIDTTARQRNAIWLMGIYPSQVGRGKQAMRRDEWIDYHFGSFSIYAAASLDVALMAVNAVYGLNIRPQACKYKRVVEDKIIRGSQCEKALARLKKVTSKHVDRRHRLVHRGERADLADIVRSDLVENLRAISLAAQLQPGFGRDFSLSRGWRVALAEVRPGLEKDFRGTCQAVAAVLKSILPVYQTIASVLDQQASSSRLLKKRVVG